MLIHAYQDSLKMSCKFFYLTRVYVQPLGSIFTFVYIHPHHLAPHKKKKNIQILKCIFVPILQMLEKLIAKKDGMFTLRLTVSIKHVPDLILETHLLIKRIHTLEML